MRNLRFAAAAALCALAAGPAGAVTFQFNNTGGAEIGTQARFGFERAAAYWGSVLRDPVTVRLDIGFQPLGPGVLGSTGSNTGARLVQNLYGDLSSDRTSALDARAVAGLQPLSPSALGPGLLALDAITSGYVDPVARTGVNTAVTFFDDEGDANNTVFDVNTANLKALGVAFDDNGEDIRNVTDGEITFSSDFPFDFDPSDGIADNSYDFIGVAVHEIGHALGFVSGVDIYDVVGRPNGPLADAFEAGAFGSPRIGDFQVMGPLDLYRYSQAGLDWSVGTEAFFSLDGANPLFGGSRFSTGAFNGDGSQASHWIDNIYEPRVNPNCSNVITAPIGIMNPTFGACESGFVTALDLAAMDAIGWDVDFDVLSNTNYRFTTAQIAAIPEPAGWALMILGLGFAGGALRRRFSA